MWLKSGGCWVLITTTDPAGASSFYLPLITSAFSFSSFRLVSKPPRLPGGTGPPKFSHACKCTMDNYHKGGQVEACDMTTELALNWAPFSCSGQKLWCVLFRSYGIHKHNVAHDCEVEGKVHICTFLRCKQFMLTNVKLLFCILTTPRDMILIVLRVIFQEGAWKCYFLLKY